MSSAHLEERIVGLSLTRHLAKRSIEMKLHIDEKTNLWCKEILSTLANNWVTPCSRIESIYISLAAIAVCTVCKSKLEVPEVVQRSLSRLSRALNSSATVFDKLNILSVCSSRNLAED